MLASKFVAMFFFSVSIFLWLKLFVSGVVDFFRIMSSSVIGSADRSVKRNRNSELERRTGHVKVWFDENGYGFIRDGNGGDDIFVHTSQVEGEGPLEKEEKVEFDYDKNGGKDGKPAAVNVIRLGDSPKRKRARAPSRSPPSLNVALNRHLPGSSSLGAIGSKNSIDVWAWLLVHACSELNISLTHACELGKSSQEKLVNFYQQKQATAWNCCSGCKRLRNGEIIHDGSQCIWGYLNYDVAVFLGGLKYRPDLERRRV